ncbi:MAG: UDP-N-acetylmuramate dehydrogenase [Desulfosarcinaceae bacterium]|nr:UDP-N-acetylmuramate dehydrogenase [Desulfosarcinaceae bacterium]
MEIQVNYPLQPLNTFGVKAQAERYVRFDELAEIAPFLAGRPNAGGPRLILGGGSNLLFAKDVHGTVLHPLLKGIDVLHQDREAVLVRVMAGEAWDDWVAAAVHNGWGGIENLSLIPGSVGASAIQNIGAYGVEVKSVIDRVEAVALADGSARVFAASQCGFGYRDSHFKRRWRGRYLITAIVFKLLRRPRFNLSYAGVQAQLKQIGPPTLANIRHAVIDLRRSKLPDPAVTGNAGSFFKNPTVSRAVLNSLRNAHPELPHYAQGDDRFKLSAAWLIEQCGWKGRALGDAAVDERHALVLVNRGEASGEEILNLSRSIATSVKKRFGVALEREVRVVPNGDTCQPGTHRPR